MQQLGAKGRGKHWLVVTSQEKLSELTGGLDDRRVELAAGGRDGTLGGDPLVGLRPDPADVGLGRDRAGPVVVHA